MSPVRFEHPPVTHVHLTINFDLEAKMQVSHLSRLRESWRDTYPHTRERPPSPRDGNSQVRFMGSGTSWPFPYLVFAADDQTLIIEEDKFALTWTFDQETGNAYPTFGTLRAELDRRFGEFCEVLAEEVEDEPVITGAECQYSNTLPGEGTARTIIGILTDWKVDVSPTSNTDFVYQGLRQHTGASEANNFTEVVVGVDPLEEPEDGVSLYIEATRDLQSEEQLSLGGIDVAHEVLIETFLRLTREDQQRDWGRTE